MQKKEVYGHPRFYKILAELADLHSRKNHDYSGGDPLSNLHECEDMGVPAWIGVAIRLTDKMSRIQSYAKKGKFLVNDEGLVDTFRDMAIYSILAIILFEDMHTHDLRSSQPAVKWMHLKVER